MNKKKERLNQFGLPVADSSPMGIIGMEGNFFRGLTGRANRPVWFRVICVLAALAFLVFPGIFILASYLVTWQANVPSGDVQWVDVALSLNPLAVGLFLFVTGVYLVISNIRKTPVKVK